MDDASDDKKHGHKTVLLTAVLAVIVGRGLVVYDIPALPTLVLIFMGLTGWQIAYKGGGAGETTPKSEGSVPATPGED